MPIAVDAEVNSSTLVEARMAVSDNRPSSSTPDTIYRMPRYALAPAMAEPSIFLMFMPAAAALFWIDANAPAV